MLEHINWELVSLVVIILSSLTFLIRTQMNINKQVFIQIAEMRKDIEANRSCVRSTEIELETIRKENREEHMLIMDKLDEIKDKIK